MSSSILVVLVKKLKAYRLISYCKIGKLFFESPKEADEAKKVIRYLAHSIVDTPLLFDMLRLSAYNDVRVRANERERDRMSVKGPR